MRGRDRKKGRGGEEEEKRGEEKAGEPVGYGLKGPAFIHVQGVCGVSARPLRMGYGGRDEYGRTLSAKRARRSLRCSPSLPPSLLPSAYSNINSILN